MKNISLLYLICLIVLGCSFHKKEPGIDSKLLIGTWKLRESGSYSENKKIQYEPDACRLLRNYEIREDHTAIYHHYEGETQNCKESLTEFTWDLKGDTLTLKESGQNPYQVRIVDFKGNRMTFNTFPEEVENSDPNYVELMKTIFYEDFEKVNK